MSYDLTEPERRCLASLHPKHWRRGVKSGAKGPNGRKCSELCIWGLVEGARLDDGTREGATIYRLTPDGVAHLEATKCEA